jgi:hypothetical protein
MKNIVFIKKVESLGLGYMFDVYVRFNGTTMKVGSDSYKGPAIAYGKSQLKKMLQGKG